MVKKKIDNRVRTLIENGVAKGHRSLFVLVGDRSRDQVIYLHHMLSKTCLKQASVLWCYKKELSFSSHRKKRIKQLKAKIKAGAMDANEDDPFETFVSMAEIRYCYYKETNKILGNTFKMCVIQDFEALTPNILCRCVETIEGGGIIIILLQSLTSLKQLFTLNMDVHARYRTQAHKHVVPRFNERFMLSLANCPTCIVMDDQLRILPISSHLKDIEPVEPGLINHLSQNEKELKETKEYTKDTPPLGTLVKICKTFDQAKVVLQFIMAITEKTLDTTISLTAARGRGKSAAMGLAIAGSIAFGYSNIYVTSPSPENLTSFFEFVIRGLKSIGFEEHLHYQVIRSSDPSLNKAVMRINISKGHRQVIQYISPVECDMLSNTEILVIDEVAAIPLPQVKALLGPYLVFMASTVSGYEGTGRSLSLKLIQQLKKECEEDSMVSSNRQRIVRKLLELKMEESIRYKDGDSVERWLYDLLCLESSAPQIPHPLPKPEECNLFYVNRDTLFGYHKTAEKFLSSIMSILVSSHYRNTPNDLQTLSDAPAHHIFVLLPPLDSKSKLPNVFCVIQLAFEGKISKEALRGTEGSNFPPGDLIPWTVSNIFQNHDFPQLSGARIVRIATHPELQGRGYGSHAIKLLEAYYAQASSRAGLENFESFPETNSDLVKDEEVDLLEERVSPRAPSLPLISPLNERPPEALHYLGVSYGISQRLLSFWKKLKFTLVYLSQVSNASTGEYSCIMLKVLGEDKASRPDSWLSPLWTDFHKRLISLIPGVFRNLNCKFALSIVTNSLYKDNGQGLPLGELHLQLSKNDVKRLEDFNNHQVESALVTDVFPRLAHTYFMGRISNCKLKPIEMVVLCGVGLQRKTPSMVASELEVKTSVIMSQLHSIVTKAKEPVLNLLEISHDNGPSNHTSEENKLATQIAASLNHDIDATHQNEDVKEKIKHLIEDSSEFRIKAKELEVVSHVRSKKKKLTLVKVS